VLDDTEKRLREKYEHEEMSKEILDLSSKLKEYKLAELKAKREAVLAREKEEYF
jgi:hypothetical protein